MAATAEHYWLIEPLLRAGMEPDEIRTRLTRLAFACLVDAEPPSVALVDDQPPEVRRAWLETVRRMIEGDR